MTQILVIIFGALFAGCLLFFTESNMGPVHDTPMVLFERGARPPVLDNARLWPTTPGADKEKGVSPMSPVKDEKAEVEEALREVPLMTDVFTWRHLEYTVQARARRLLDDASEYVTPGKLTVLMGESGAGKVSFLFDFWCGGLMRSRLHC